MKKYPSKNRDFRNLEPSARSGFNQAVVIPVYAESNYLPETLRSLSLNGKQFLDGTAVVLVLNNPPRVSADPAKVSDNDSILKKLRNSQYPFQKELNLFWIDASSVACEIPVKEGVGTARKLGIDRAIEFLLEQTHSSLVFSLDADTLVEGNYLEEGIRFFEEYQEASGATVNFAHQKGGTESENIAITRYELFIRFYVEALRFSQSPYAYHVLGSAMVFKADAYIGAGGMRRRNGGEDFYFLQALAKTGILGQITGTCVHPSARMSDRVPFGTGPRISSIVDGEDIKCYNPVIFVLLKTFFNDLKESGYLIEKDKIQNVNPEVFLFLEDNDFFSSWEKIKVNTPAGADKIGQAFHVWFDAFRTLKFVHFCENRWPENFPRREILAAFDEICRMVGKRGGIILRGEKALLASLREREKCVKI